MYKKNTLNNIILSNKRKDPVYQAVMTDLALAGAIDMKIAEALLGYKIPDYLKLPLDFDEKLAAAIAEEAVPEAVEEVETVDDEVTSEETPTSDSNQNEPVDENSANEQAVDSEVADDETGNQ